MLLLLLSITTILLLSASSVLSASPASANDAFRAIAVHVPQKTDPPICCLKPQQPIESIEDELLLSFEEWKQKQFTVQEKERARERDNNRSAHTVTAGKGSGVNLNGNDTEASVLDTQNTSYLGDIEQPAQDPKAEPLPPHFRIPLTDRFNYASLECSARVHMANRLAKSSSSILSSKRDRYMLSPCNPPNKEKQFVVVELCDDIRIDTVQLANFEFFSGIFKDFRISVAKTHITREDAWTDVGFFRAKNVRGVQSFHPPTSLRDFYRYIRIEFLSHYGNEYYCPVSLLRVYGLTHLEQWKWDIWEQESLAKLDANDARALPSPVGVGDGANPTIVEPVAELSAGGISVGEVGSRQILEAPTTVAQEDVSRSTAGGEKDQFHLSAWKLSPSTPSAQTLSLHETASSNSESHIPTASLHEPHSTYVESLKAEATLTPAASLQSDTTTPVPQHSQVSTSLATALPPPSDGSSIKNSVTTSKVPINHTSQTITSKSATTTTTTTVAVTSSLVVISTISPHSAPSTTGGESIYKTIMNRLTALESNHTLYTRYIEQQTGAVRELLKRLMEDVGRLEGIGKAQNQMHQRTLRDWEKRQQQLQMEYGVLMARVEYLADEIVLEKRLGIAQLCLLLAVLIFMGLTRGSRGDAQPVHITGSMREWGRRHLSFSGDWSKHLGRGRGDVPKPHSAAAWPVPLVLRPDLDDDDLKLNREDTNKRMPLETLRMNVRSTSSDPRLSSRAKSRSRTPSIRNNARTHQYVLPKPPSTPTHARPRLQRSSSQTAGTEVTGTEAGGGGGTGPTHKSTKKWARTAHLHEVRGGERRVGNNNHNNRVRVDSFGNGNRGCSRRGGGAETGFGVERNGNGEGRVFDPFWVGEDGKLTTGMKGDGDDGRELARPVMFKSMEEGEGDGWVDTDFEGEDGDWELRHRAVVFPVVEDGR